MHAGRSSSPTLHTHQHTARATAAPQNSGVAARLGARARTPRTHAAARGTQATAAGDCARRTQAVARVGTHNARSMTDDQAAAAAVVERAQQHEEAIRSLPHYRVVPYSHHKVLHLIRHGEGFHNVAGRQNHDNYKDWAYEDAHLTEFGWKQARAVAEHIRANSIRVDVVVVSPLTRALETAVGCFADLSAPPANGDAPLMAAQSEQPGVRAAHPAVSAAGAPRFVAYELCREHLGVHPCDKRHPMSVKQRMFPAVDFSGIRDERDVLWHPHHRETRAEIQARGRAFMQQLMARPETHIAVVTHSSFLHFMMTNFGHEAAPQVQGALHRWFENAELRSVVVADERPDQAPNKHAGDFPGFPHSVQEGPSV